MYANYKQHLNEFSQTSLKWQGLLLLEQGIARVCSIGKSYKVKVFSSSFYNTVFRTSGPLVARKSFELVIPSRPLSPHVPSAFYWVPHGELVCPSVVVHPRDEAAPFPFKSLC